MSIVLVNDALSQLNERTFWHDLQDWFACKFVGAPFHNIIEATRTATEEASLIIRNGSYFGPLPASLRVPTISLIQDISTDGEMRKMQDAVILSSKVVVYNSEYTYSHYKSANGRVISLPVDFTRFVPGNAMGLQQALSLPDGCVCWIGAQTPIKGWDTFLGIVRANPDIPFVGVFKDAAPEYGPPNLRTYARLSHDKLVEVIGACRVGLCTSRTESQHLAGIEMGACGLPLVVPSVGTYWKRDDMPGIIVTPQTTVDAERGQFTLAIRATLANPGDPQAIRAYWRKKFDKPAVRAAWEALVEEVENVPTIT